MYDKVVFYNHFGAGDVYESREFVKELIKIIPANEYQYAHSKSPQIIADISEIESIEVTPIMDSMRDSYVLDNILYWNTWIGRDGKYVLPGIGCTVEELYRMHNDILRKWRLGKLSRKPVDYIPKLDYSFYPKTANVASFMNEHKEDKIFIDNGLCQSMQAHNFDFLPIIYRLSGHFKDKLFILTHSIAERFENIVTTSDIIASDGFDLVEVAYVSEFCSTLIGRNSGPHVHTQNYNNCMNENKKLLSFTYQVTGSSFVVNTPVLIKKHWPPYQSMDDTFKVICEVIND